MTKAKNHRLKAKTAERLRADAENIKRGDLVTSDFESKTIMTYIKASENHYGPLMGDGPPFYKHDIGLIVDIYETPESFYSYSYCRLLLRTGELGWIPSRWLKLVTRKTF